MLLWFAPLAEARPPAAFDGRPDGLRAGLTARYWVWTDAGGLHLRWTTSGERRRFAGTLSADDGTAPSPVVAVSDAGQAAAPRIQRGEAGAVSFEAWCQGGIAGLDLPPPSSRLTLALSLDGLPAPLHALHLGAGLIHPRRNPLKLLPPAPPVGGLEHHPHPHPVPHPAAAHHEHPHAHPHPPGLGHHHRR